MHEGDSIVEPECLIAKIGHLSLGEFGKDQLDQSGVLVGTLELCALADDASFGHDTQRMLLLRAS